MNTCRQSTVARPESVSSRQLSSAGQEKASFLPFQPPDLGTTSGDRQVLVGNTLKKGVYINIYLSNNHSLDLA